ncbi:hypothetical protein [Rummeliibacillus stabekisii]|uniref:hypothetical protein n=1 Tax=Rummeliibacillus stabekisii TaxID=241244 RepID=UPI003718092E
MFNSLNDYIENFSERIRDLNDIKLEYLPDLEVRKSEVNGMLEEYYSVVGDYPKSYNLTLLANYLMSDVLKDKDVDKMTNYDYPILSESQDKRRKKKQNPMIDDTLDFLNNKYHRRLDSLTRRITEEKSL